LLKKHRTIYCPENCILCVVGGNKFEDVVNISNKYISSIERKGEKLRDISIEKRKRNNYENRNNLSQANLCLGIHFPSFSNELRYSAEIFNMILGVGMSSKLFSEVREKRGLVYGIRSELDLGRNYGYMVIWAGCDKKNISEVIKISKEEFEKMKDINEQELEDAKIQLIGSRKVHNSGLNEVAINLIMEEFNSNAKNYYEYEKKINNVKREEIKKLCTNLDFASYYLI
jgi:zinc protease